MRRRDESGQGRWRQFALRLTLCSAAFESAARAAYARGVHSSSAEERKYRLHVLDEGRWARHVQEEEFFDMNQITVMRVSSLEDDVDSSSDA
jgi:hypothetical protein